MFIECSKITATMKTMEKPTLFIFCGLPFSGKTTFGKLLADTYGFIRVDMDEIKFAHGFQDVSDDNMSNEDWKKIYEEVYQKIGATLATGNSVICDFSNLERSERDALRDIANHYNSSSVVAYFNAPAEFIRARWLKNKITNARFDLTKKVMEEAIHDIEIPTNDERVITLDYRRPEEWLDAFKNVLTA